MPTRVTIIAAPQSGERRLTARANRERVGRLNQRLACAAVSEYDFFLIDSLVRLKHTWPRLLSLHFCFGIARPLESPLIRRFVRPPGPCRAVFLYLPQIEDPEAVKNDTASLVPVVYFGVCMRASHDGPELYPIIWTR